MDERTGAYRGFFQKNQFGQEFVDWLKTSIDNYHREAERNPETARDNAQKAASMRDVIDHIDSITAKRKGEPI